MPTFDLRSLALDCTPWPSCYGQIGIATEQQGIAVLTQAGAEMSHKGARRPLYCQHTGHHSQPNILLSIKQRMRGQPGLLAATVLMATTLFLAILGSYTISNDPLGNLGNLGGGMLMAALLWWLDKNPLLSIVRQPLKRLARLGNHCAASD